jgi:hypothetical protein
VQKAVLDPSVTYSNLGNVTLNKAVQDFRTASAAVDSMADDVYKKSDSVDSANAKVTDAETKLKEAKTGEALAAARVKEAEELLKKASVQSRLEMQTALQAAERARSDVKTERDNAQKGLEMAQKDLVIAQRDRANARKIFNDANAALEDERKKPNHPAKNWKNTDKQKTRQAILANAKTKDTQNIDMLVEEALQLAHQSRADIDPWSAVFVVSCVRAAAIGLKLETMDSSGAHMGVNGLLNASQRHAEYIVEARKNKHKGVGGRYHAFEPTDRSVQVGDIICTDRRSFIGTVVRLEDLPPKFLVHSDIVTFVKIEKGKPVYAETVGGNVGHTVRRRLYPLNDLGQLIVSTTVLVPKEKDDGTFEVLMPLAQIPSMLPSNSTARIFALLSLVEECRPATP